MRYEKDFEEMCFCELRSDLFSVALIGGCSLSVEDRFGRLFGVLRCGGC